MQTRGRDGNGKIVIKKIRRGRIRREVDMGFGKGERVEKNREKNKERESRVNSLTSTRLFASSLSPSKRAVNLVTFSVTVTFSAQPTFFHFFSFHAKAVFVLKKKVYDFFYIVLLFI